MARTIVGIDPSLTGTAVVIDGKATMFKSKPHEPTVRARLTRIQELALAVTNFVSPRPDMAIFIEGYSLTANPTGATTLCEYGGLLRLYLLTEGSAMYEVPPSSLKKFATGKGNSKKDLVAAHIAKRYGVMFDTNDAYDAYGLYRFGLVAMGMEDPANQAQLEAVQAVMNPKPKAPKKSRRAK